MTARQYQGRAKYTISIALALMLVCGTAWAEDGPRLSERQYEALRAAVGGSGAEHPDPPDAGNYRRSAKMTADGVIVAIDSRKPGVLDIAYVPGDNAASAADVINNNTTQAAIDNMTQMSHDLAVMKHDTQIINAAIAQGKKPDQEFRDAFEKAEQAANGAVEQPIGNTFVQIVPIKEPPVTKVQESTAHKSLVSLEKKDTK